LERRIGLLPGVDLLSERSYAASPPSDNGAGTYSWIPGLSLDSVGLAELPGWVMKLAGEETVTADKPRRDPLPAFRGNLPPGAPAGQRNSVLARYVGAWLAMALPVLALKARAEAWTSTCDPGDHFFTKGEALAVVASIAKAEVAQTRFPVRGIRLPRSLLKADLQPGALLLAALLASDAQTGEPRRRQQDLAAVLGSSSRQVRRWLVCLAEAGWSTERLYERPRQRYFTIGPALLETADLAAAVRASALVLGSYANPATGMARVGQEALAKVRGVSRRTCIRHLLILERAGWLERGRAPYDTTLGRRARVNLYVLHSEKRTCVTHTLKAVGVIGHSAFSETLGRDPNSVEPPKITPATPPERVSRPAGAAVTEDPLQSGGKPGANRGQSRCSRDRAVLHANPLQDWPPGQKADIGGTLPGRELEARVLAGLSAGTLTAEDPFYREYLRRLTQGKLTPEKVQR